MNIGEILIWEATNGLLLIPIVIGLVMLTRWMRGGPSVYTERDWLFLTWPSAGESSLASPWLRFAALWVAVVLIGFVEGYVLLPFGLVAFLGAVFLTVFVIWRVAPKWLRVNRGSRGMRRLRHPLANFVYTRQYGSRRLA